jgi:hypothetical protein
MPSRQKHLDVALRDAAKCLRVASGLLRPGQTRIETILKSKIDIALQALGSGAVWFSLNN